MTPDQRDLLAKARESLRAAQLLLSNRLFDFAASRAYYTMFYVAQTFLEGEGLAFSKHTAVIAKFGELFAHGGKVPVELHRAIIDAEKLRAAGDYGKPHSVSEDRARQVVADAERFLEVGDRLIT